MSLTIQRIQAVYGRQTVLSDLSLSAHPGEVFALIGPNGSGKSTLLKSMAGLCRYQGEIKLAEKTLPALGVRKHDAVAYLPQDLSCHSSLTVLETVLLGLSKQLGLRVRPAQKEAALRMLARTGMAALAHQPVRSLSGGQRQLVFLAQAMVGEPSVLLLDEPISALDIRHQLEILDLVRALTQEKQLITIVVLHDMNAALRVADQVGLLSGGQLVMSGDKATVLSSRQLREVFRVESTWLTTPCQQPVFVPLMPAA